MKVMTRHHVARLGLGARHGRRMRDSHGKLLDCGDQRRRRPVLRLCGLALLVITTLIVSGPATRASFEATASNVSPTPCPTSVASNQCVSATPPGCSSSCPVATVGPTEAVADDGYVYVSLTGYTAGDWVAINFCPATSLGSGADPVCAFGPYEGITFVPADVKILPDGTGLLSYQVTSDAASDGSAGIPGLDVQENDSTTTPFFCDNSSDPCVLEITDIGQGASGTKPGVPDETTQNTTVVPLSFEANTGGCPSSDPIINSEGSFSVNQFVPAAVVATCADSTGVIDLNSQTDSETAVSDFSTSSPTATLAFTDDPTDPASLKALAGSQYMLIPVAASASVVSFLSATSAQLGQAEYAASPQAHYNLTPNMTAGLITSAYNNSYGSDVLVPPLTCKELGCKVSQSGSENTFDLLNPSPTGFVGPGNMTSSFSSVATGASDEITGWLCSMPNVPLTISANGTTFPGVVDKNTATKTLSTDVTNTQPWPFTSCTNYPTIPTVGTPAGTYQPAQNPANQAVQIRKEWAGGTPGPSPGLYGPLAAAGFGAMDWGDAAFYGLDAASLQNAAGNFVAPSETSIDAALSDAGTVSTPGGPALSYDYTTSDPAAYPTPTVSYALISLAPQSGDQVVDETDLLTNIVNYSHDPSSSLPGGYVPLPDNLFAQATSDIKSALSSIVETSPPTPRTTGTSASSSTSSTTVPGTTPFSGSNPDSVGGNHLSSLPTLRLGTGLVFAKPTVAAAPRTTSSKAKSGPKHPPAPINRGFVPSVFALVAGGDRLILPVLLGAMAATLPAGVLLMVGVRLRRRRLRRIAVTEGT